MFVHEIVFSVKLNNPQMGTETGMIKLDATRRRKWVKLNNPQMGTETDKYCTKQFKLIWE